MPAKLPPERIAEPRRYLRELEVGQRCEIWFTDMRVDTRGFCCLDPTAPVYSAGSGELMVTRDAAGYHVAVSHRLKSRFLRKPSFWLHPFRKWIPVESLSEMRGHKCIVPGLT